HAGRLGRTCLRECLLEHGERGRRDGAEKESLDCGIHVPAWKREAGLHAERGCRLRAYVVVAPLCGSGVAHREPRPAGSAHEQALAERVAPPGTMTHAEGVLPDPKADRRLPVRADERGEETRDPDPAVFGYRPLDAVSLVADAAVELHLGFSEEVET